MLRGAVLLSLVVVGALAILPGPQLMVKKYAYMKIMSGCVGEETVLGWQQQMRAASDKCQGAQALDLSPDFQDMLSELRKTANLRPVYIPVPVYQPGPQLPQTTSQYTQVPQYGQPPQYGSSSLQGMPGIRTKRFADLSPERIKRLKSAITAKISNVTCVLRELKMLDSNNLPNYEYIGKETLNLPVGDALKADMAESIEVCKDYSTCLPAAKAKHPLEKELGPIVAFLRCMAMKKVAACMKADYRKYSSQMGWLEDLEDSFLAASGFLTTENTQQSLMEEVGALLYGGAEITL